MATIFFSIILPVFDEFKETAPTLASLSQQSAAFEVIIVQRNRSSEDPPQLDQKLEVITCPGVSRGMLLNAGADKAAGDILLFLWPGSRLPENGLQAIETNFTLLPQSIGGNFHVKFDDNSLFSQGLKRLLKKWRYQGRYFGQSGIFVRREVFEALGGFGNYDLLEDHNFTQRLEKYGATLFLPNYITASARNIQERKLQATISWLVIYSLYRLGVSPNNLAKFYYG